ncbi:MAG: TlpA family protein disulfide reductase, partial [Pseudobdellovibrio sp.]
MKLQDLTVLKWLGTTDDFSLNDLQGRVVLVHAFQMLCPGCVLHGVPQAQKVFETFKQEKVAVLGLHTVFEHHEA